jgi:hypothetical protein
MDNLLFFLCCTSVASVCLSIRALIQVRNLREWAKCASRDADGVSDALYRAGMRPKKCDRPEAAFRFWDDK